MNFQECLPRLVLNGPGPSGLGEQADLSFIHNTSGVFKSRNRETFLLYKALMTHPSSQKPRNLSAGFHADSGLVLSRIW